MNELGKHLEVWEEYPDVWPTKASFFTWLRGAFRKAVWQFYPPKNILKNEQSYKPPKSYKGRAKKLGKCALTGEELPISSMEVDHIKGNVSLKEWDDIPSFIRHLCASKGDMQLVSKEAHKIKSYAERMGITFEEAVLEKKVIVLSKLKAAEQIEILEKLGCREKHLATTTRRKIWYRNYLKSKEAIK